MTVAFRDIPEAITGAPTLSEARVLARDALSVALEARVDNREPIPAPGARQADSDIAVSPSARIAAKALVLRLMQVHSMKAATLADALGVPPSEINRILDPRHRTSLDRLEAAIEAMGGELRLSADTPDERVLAAWGDVASEFNSRNSAAILKAMSDAQHFVAEAMVALKVAETSLGANDTAQAKPAKQRA